MRALRDRDIRPALKAKLFKQQPRAIIDELRIDDGRAIADVVALFEEAHCYEIKGSTDKIDRLKTQGSFFSQSFRRITLVTTENHLKQAEHLVPAYWGLVVAMSTADNGSESGIKFKHVRGAIINPSFCKTTALLTLWRKELVELLGQDDPAAKKGSRSMLADKISKKLSKPDLSRSLTHALAARPTSPESY